MNAITYRGERAVLTWGYLEAGTVGTWTVTVDPTGADLSASVVAIDAFRVAQHPMTFAVARPTGTWRWPVESLRVEGETLTARLGPPKE